MPVFHLIRHAECVHNRSTNIHEILESELAGNGKQEARDLV